MTGLLDDLTCRGLLYDELQSEFKSRPVSIGQYNVSLRKHTYVRVQIYNMSQLQSHPTTTNNNNNNTITTTTTTNTTTIMMDDRCVLFEDLQLALEPLESKIADVGLKLELCIALNPNREYCQYLSEIARRVKTSVPETYISVKRSNDNERLSIGTIVS